MIDFKITYNAAQQQNLRDIGFIGLANDPEGLDTISYIKSLLDYLISHNKNYTKEQYSKIDILNDIINAIYNGI